jgi:hypothetical protein
MKRSREPKGQRYLNISTLSSKDWPADFTDGQQQSSLQGAAQQCQPPLRTAVVHVARAGRPLAGGVAQTPARVSVPYGAGT